jgi:hypothetical protein
MTYRDLLPDLSLVAFTPIALFYGVGSPDIQRATGRRSPKKKLGHFTSLYLMLIPNSASKEG